MTVCRRRLLQLAGLAGVTTIAGCSDAGGDDTQTDADQTDDDQTSDSPSDDEPAPDDDDETTAETTDEHIDLLDTDRLIGAHYYPWHGEAAPEWVPHGEGWTDESPSDPKLGEYDSRDPDVINQHLKWCLEHGITWLSVCWWGIDDEDEYIDETIREYLLPADHFDHMQFSILYETVGQFHQGAIDMGDEQNRQQLADDLSYLAETYFDHANYLHLDGRPVVFFYVAHGFQGEVSGAFEEAADAAGVEPYVLADIPHGSAPDAHAITEVADGVTTYNPYEPRDDIAEVFHELYADGLATMNLGANATGLDFVPAIIPGYDDTAIIHQDRPENPPLSSSPERFERSSEQLQPHLADAEAVLITSFNEWYENTIVEPTQEYGTDYLELVGDTLATGGSEGFDPEGAVVEVDWETTVDEADREPDVENGRQLAFMCTNLELRDEGGNQITTYDIGSGDDEPLFIGGADGTEADNGTTWRWFGGLNERTVFLVENTDEEINEVVLHGTVVQHMDVEVSIDDRTTSTALWEGDQEHEIRL